jgi:hypothetical protein
VKTSNDYRWLRSIHRYWILQAETVSILLFIAAFTLAPVLSFLDVEHLVGWTFGGLLLASFLAALTQHFLFYRAIRCPICGFNPTRHKNGKNLPRKTAWKRLASMDNCPSCHGNRNVREAA